MYLGPGNYPGHSYQLVYRRGSAFGTGYGCPNYEPRCSIEAEQLADQYGFGFTDGHDIGRHEGARGRPCGGLRGRSGRAHPYPGRWRARRLRGAFAPASYVRETFGDRKALRYGGAGLLAAGALLGLIWPRAANLDLTPLPGGGRVAASLGF